jgi:hypothetical protein
MNRFELRPNTICDVYTNPCHAATGISPVDMGIAKIARVSVSSIIGLDVQLGLSHRAKPQPI